VLKKGIIGVKREIIGAEKARLLMLKKRDY